MTCELLNVDEDSWLAGIVRSQSCCHLNVQRYFHAEYLPSDMDIVPSKKKSGTWRQKRAKMQAAILLVCRHSFGMFWSMLSSSIFSLVVCWFLYNLEKPSCT